MAALQDSNWSASSSTILVVRLVYVVHAWQRLQFTGRSNEEGLKRRRLPQLFLLFRRSGMSIAQYGVHVMYCEVTPTASFRKLLLQGSAVIYKFVKRGHKKFCTSYAYWKVCVLICLMPNLPLEKIESALLHTWLHSSQMHI